MALGGCAGSPVGERASWQLVHAHRCASFCRYYYKVVMNEQLREFNAAKPSRVNAPASAKRASAPDARLHNNENMTFQEGTHPWGGPVGEDVHSKFMQHSRPVPDKAADDSSNPCGLENRLEELRVNGRTDEAMAGLFKYMASLNLDPSQVLKREVVERFQHLKVGQEAVPTGAPRIRYFLPARGPRYYLIAA